MNGNLRKTAFGLLMAVALIAGTFTAEARDEDPVKIDDIWYVMDDSDMTAIGAELGTASLGFNLSNT